MTYPFGCLGFLGVGGSSPDSSARFIHTLMTALADVLRSMHIARNRMASVRSTTSCKVGRAFGFCLPISEHGCIGGLSRQFAAVDFRNKGVYHWC